MPLLKVEVPNLRGMFADLQVGQQIEASRLEAAGHDVDELIELGKVSEVKPKAEAPKPTAAQKAFNEEFGDLAETFRGLGFDTRTKLKAASEEELRAIPGVDDAVIAKINK